MLCMSVYISSWYVKAIVISLDFTYFLEGGGLYITTEMSSAHRRCAYNSILSHMPILNQRVVFPERRDMSLAVCKTHMDKQSSNF